jgi:aldehyde dehydrogenase (NAD+)
MEVVESEAMAALSDGGTSQAVDGLYCGQFQQGQGPLLDVVDPSDGRAFAQVRTASPGQIADTIGAARSAFDSGVWSGLPIAERAAYLRRMLQHMEGQSARLLDLLVREAGVVRGSMTRPIHVDVALRHGFQCIDLALTLPEAVDNPIPIAERATPNYLLESFQRYEPVGVVAAISAYNVPLFIGLWKIIPALITGNTVILRPSPLTPLATLLIGEAASAAGLPDGVLNIVAEAGNDGAVLLSTDRRIDMVTFTGSSAVGKQVIRQSADTMKRYQLELGGKSAQIYLPDALELAAGAADRVCGVQSGQGCVLGTRIFVPAAEKAALLDRMVQSVGKMTVGPAEGADTVVGPVINAAAVERCEAIVAAAVAAGGRVVAGGRRPAHLTEGFYFEPTILDVPDNSNPAAQEEIFGPVVCVIGYDNLDHAVAMANDTQYGLSGHVFGKDMKAAMDVALRLRTGTVNINGGMISAYASSGGRKLSGFGRERGVEGIRIYQEIKCISITR